MSVAGGQTAVQDFTPASEDIIIKINNNEHEFELKSGENFYFVLYQTIGSEKHVAGN